MGELAKLGKYLNQGVPTTRLSVGRFGGAGMAHSVIEGCKLPTYKRSRRTSLGRGWDGAAVDVDGSGSGLGYERREDVVVVATVSGGGLGEPAALIVVECKGPTLNLALTFACLSLPSYCYCYKRQATKIVATRRSITPYAAYILPSSEARKRSRPSGNIAGNGLQMPLCEKHCLCARSSGK
jgi:hypothetical protein